MYVPYITIKSRGVSRALPNIYDRAFSPKSLTATNCCLFSQKRLIIDVKQGLSTPLRNQQNNAYEMIFDPQNIK